MNSRLPLFFLALIWVGVGGCAHHPEATLTRFEFERPEMGLPFRVVLYAETPAKARQASEAAFQRISDLNACLSDYDEQSELSRLSKASGSIDSRPVSDDLWKVLKRAEDISRSSDGAFDITVGPLVQVWKRARRQRELPSEERLAEARSRVSWKAVVLDGGPRPPRDASGKIPHTARLTLPGMRLDPGGIAKGYALGEAANVLREQGIQSFLVSGGGDMMAGDPPPGKKGWGVEVGVYDAPGAPGPRFIELRNYALATSGDQFQRAEIQGVRYSHIVDPRSGRALTDHSLVTLVGPDAMTTDALSKVISVLGPVEGMKRIRAYPGVECLVYRKPAETVEEYQSKGLKKWLGPQNPTNTFDFLNLQ